MLEEAKIVSFDVGLRVYTRTRTKERERERERFRERKIQRETARKREEEERLVFRSGLCSFALAYVKKGRLIFVSN